MTDIQVEMVTKPENLKKSLQALKGTAITYNEYISDVPGYINDMEWNFYDEIHRIHVHNTYHDMLKVFSGKTFSVNLVKFGKWPVFIQVSNAKVAPNIFYQTMSLGFFYIHQIMKLEQLDRKVRVTRQWYTVSHWLFKPLHTYLNARLMKLQIKQDIEDNETIRERRLALRDTGYRFTTDKADFVNSNKLTDNVIFPPDKKAASIHIADLANNTTQKITVGILELLVTRQNNLLLVWPGICPHEGASLTPDNVCTGIVKCPWHGRLFKGVLIQEGAPAWRFMNFVVKIEKAALIVSQVEALVEAKVS